MGRRTSGKEKRKGERAQTGLSCVPGAQRLAGRGRKLGCRRLWQRRREPRSKWWVPPRRQVPFSPNFLTRHPPSPTNYGRMAKAVFQRNLTAQRVVSKGNMRSQQCICNKERCGKWEGAGPAVRACCKPAWSCKPVCSGCSGKSPEERRVPVT